MKNKIYIIPILITLVSCHPGRVSVNPVPDIRHGNSDVERYTSIYADRAMSEMSRTGIPASITLAQGIIESDYGRSRLAKEANNHFGIKCHSNWKGKKIYHDDDRRNECFRKYNNPEESFRDHSDFLVTGSRYDFLFDLREGDYKAWAKGLKTAGYATNPKYASMLIRTIEDNKLYLYDNMVMGKDRKSIQAATGTDTKEKVTAQPDNQVENIIDDDFVVVNASNRVKERNRIQYIIVREGDTYESLAREFDLLSWEIFRYNDLPDGAQLVVGQLVYLQPKRARAEAGKEFHIIKEGETMYTISQLYGIKLRTLYERNGLVVGRKPETGTELWLRKTKPEGALEIVIDDLLTPLR